MHHSIYIHSLLISVIFIMGSYSQAVFAKASDDVTIVQAYVRAVPPNQPNSASFMQLINRSGIAHAIVSAKSDVAQIVELHTHLNEGGMMKMRRIEKINIPANGQTVLQPGGLHIMLIKLVQGLIVGQQVKVVLTFEDGSSKELVAPVQKVMMKHMKMMKHKMGHSTMKH